MLPMPTLAVVLAQRAESQSKLHTIEYNPQKNNWMRCEPFFCNLKMLVNFDF